MFLPKKAALIIFLLFSLIAQLLITNYSFAEDKPPGEIIPKLPKTSNDPELFNGHVYPEWGPVCMRYTYLVVYRDKEGRAPEYVKIYFNGQMIDMQKSNPADNNYRKGVQYEYKYVPNKLGSNFYFFEASNGLGKARDSIIDSPDNGPVLFQSAFDKNEIVLIEPATGNVVWRFSTGKEWVGGVALSADGQYLAAQTSKHIYFFSTSSNKPIWEYEFGKFLPIGTGPRGNGIAISKDGTKIFAPVGNKVALFGSKNNQPIWEYKTPSSVLAVAISADGNYAAASSTEEDSNNILFFWNTQNSSPAWKFTSDSNFHDFSLSADGNFVAASTGCPDRKAYIFSKESNQPLVKSERLTLDSPVSKAKISGNGLLAAFATEGGPDSSVVVLFSKDSPTPLWKFDNQKRNSSRAMSITTDGQFIAAGTMKGDVYLLSSKSNIPLKSWVLDTSVGALDIAEDGSFIALGGSDNQIQILFTDGKTKKISAGEFVQAIDIAQNGKYLAAGTGGSVYFFEEYISPNANKVFDCSTVIEPPPLEKAMMEYFGDKKPPIAGFGKEPPLKKNLPSILKEVFSLAGVLIVAWFLIIRFAEKFSLIHPIFVLISLPVAIILWGTNHYQFNFRQITDFCASAFSLWTILILLGWKLKIPKVFYLLGALYLAILGTITLTYYQPFFSFPTLVHLLEAVLGFGYLSSFFKNKTRIIFLALVVIVLSLAHLFYQSRGMLFITTKLENPPLEEKTSAPSGEAVCGNNLCEPDFGESKENCPQDCSGED